jgi:hypothetical protein
MTRLGIVLLAIFFDLATCIFAAVGIALIWPDTAFDVIWLLRPDHQAMLWPYRHIVGPLFLLFTIPAALASFGFFRLRPWARELAIAIFAANAAGDLLQMTRGHTWEGAFVATLAGLLLVFLTSPGVRNAFADRAATA